MPEAGWLLLLLFLGLCSLVLVALFWPSFRRATTQKALTNTPIVLGEAHKTAMTQLNTLNLEQLLVIVNDRPDDAPHTLIVGTSGSGKTTLAQAIASARSGALAILDPKWQPGKWGGLPAVPIDDDGKYVQLETAITALLSELSTRLVSLKAGTRDFVEVTIIAEELPTLIQECPSAAQLFKQVGRLGRELRIRLVGLSQSERVKSLGVAGEGDARDNYTLIRLGKAAIDTLPETRALTRPAILEWKGEQYLLTLDGIMDFAKRSIPISRSWAVVLPSGISQKQILQQDIKQSHEIVFSVEEIAAIAFMIAKDVEKGSIIRSMPRYNRKQHQRYATFYERLLAAIRASTTDKK
jgi:hypothetical protein